MSDEKNNTESTSPKMPIWVLMAFSSIQKRKHAIMLIWSCVIFTVYCLPFVNFIDNEIVATLFLIDDWSWIAMMIPMCIWYVLSLQWMDKNDAWEKS